MILTKIFYKCRITAYRSIITSFLLTVDTLEFAVLLCFGFQFLTHCYFQVVYTAYSIDHCMTEIGENLATLLEVLRQVEMYSNVHIKNARYTAVIMGLPVRT